MATFNDFPHATPGPLIHTPPRFHALNILTIFDIFNLQLGIFVYDSYNSIGPSSDIINFIRANSVHSHSTRYAHSNSFFQNYSRTTRYGLKSLQIEGTHLWSTIPLVIKELNSKILFKTCSSKKCSNKLNQF